jgi:hypothetical protein
MPIRPALVAIAVVVALLFISARVERARNARVARRQAVTDAVHRSWARPPGDRAGAAARAGPRLTAFHGWAAVVFDGAMDYDEYAATLLVKQRHAELMAEVRRRSLLQHRRRPQSLRVTLGAALIRAGAWLMREPREASRGALQG